MNQRPAVLLYAAALAAIAGGFFYAICQRVGETLFSVRSKEQSGGTPPDPTPPTDS